MKRSGPHRHLLRYPAALKVALAEKHALHLSSNSAKTCKSVNSYMVELLRQSLVLHPVLMGGTPAFEENDVDLTLRVPQPVYAHLCEARTLAADQFSRAELSFNKEVVSRLALMVQYEWPGVLGEWGALSQAVGKIAADCPDQQRQALFAACERFERILRHTVAATTT